MTVVSATTLNFQPLVELGRRLIQEPASASPCKIDPRPLVNLGRRLLLEEVADLERFRDRFMHNPDVYRAYWMGLSALERRKLTVPQRKMIGVLGRSPDLLEPMSKRWNEVSHTQTLAWFLQRSHRLRKAFFSMLQRAIPRKMDRPPAEAYDADSWSVLAERGGKTGRVDVWMESNRAAILVEAKLGAQEGKDQIAHYNSLRKDHHVRLQWWIVVFLTVDADQVPGGPALHVTFADLLRAWLPAAVDASFELQDPLASYLASVARVCGVGGVGDFDDWSPEIRRDAINLVRET